MQFDGQRGDLLPRSERLVTSNRTRCLLRGREIDVPARRHMRRQGRLPPLAAQHALQGIGVRHDVEQVHGGVDVRRDGNVRHAERDHVQSLRLPGCKSVFCDMHGDKQRVRERKCMRERLVRAEAGRRNLRGRQRMPAFSLRRQGVLRPGVQRDVPDVQSGGDARRVQVGCGRAGSARGLSHGSRTERELPARQVQRRQPMQCGDAWHDMHERHVFGRYGDRRGNVRRERQLPGASRRAVQSVSVRCIDLQETVRGGRGLRERILLLGGGVSRAEEPGRESVHPRLRMPIRALVFARGHLLQLAVHRRVSGVQLGWDVLSDACECPTAGGTWHVHGCGRSAVRRVLRRRRYRVFLSDDAVLGGELRVLPGGRMPFGARRELFQWDVPQCSPGFVQRLHLQRHRLPAGLRPEQ
jgi:hypothetical protein